MRTGMETDSRSLVEENPEWRFLLAAYAAEEAAAAAAPVKTAPAPVTAAAPPKTVRSVPVRADDSAEGDAAGLGEEGAEEEGSRRQWIWVRRLTRVEGVPPEQMAPLHGRLIAEGLLQFQLNDRDSGVVYRLSREARQVLAAIGSSVAEPISHAA